MSWRPEGWDARELWGEQFGYTSAFTESDRALVEFGADAMLEGLKKNSVPYEAFRPTTITSLTKGRVVFIPDEKS